MPSAKKAATPRRPRTRRGNTPSQELATPRRRRTRKGATPSQELPNTQGAGLLARRPQVPDRRIGDRHREVSDHRQGHHLTKMPTDGMDPQRIGAPGLVHLCQDTGGNGMPRRIAHTGYGNQDRKDPETVGEGGDEVTARHPEECDPQLRHD